MGAGRGQALDVVAVEANSLRRCGIVGSGAPDFDGDVGRGGNEGFVVLGEGEIVDPVRVGLDLLTERGCGLWGRRGVVEAGERAVALAVLGGLEVEVQVPGADDAVPAARVAVWRRLSAGGGGQVGREGDDVQDGVVGIYGEAIDAEPVATC